MRNGLLSLLIALALPSLALGQRSTASLSGTVADASGALIPDAHVTAIATSTGTRTEGVTSSDGFYVLTGLLPDTYRLRVEKVGFQTFTAENVIVQVDRAATLNVTLTVGSQTQSVTVTSVADQVNLRSQTLTYSIPTQAIQDLPLNGRNVTQLMALAPDSGVTTGGYLGNSSFFQGATRPEDQFALVSANGGNGRSTAFYLDGGLNEDGYTEGANIYPNPDAIQEFAYETNNYSAKFGGRGGAVMNAVTRGGSNQFHGVGFEYLRNTDLNARNFFATAQDGLKRNQFGGAIGGPVIKDNTFFFFNYQGTRLNSAPTTNVQTTLTAAQRNGDFSNLYPKTQLIDPNTGLPLQNNQVPMAEFNPISLKELALLPVGAPGTGLATYTTTMIANTDQYVSRVDHNFGSKFRLYGSYLHDHLVEPSTEDPHDLLTAARPSDWTSQTVTLNATYLAKPNLIGSFVASFSRRLFLTTHPGPPKGLPGYQDLGMQGVPKLSPPGTTEVVIRVGNYMQSVLGGAQGLNTSNQLNFGTHWTYIRSKHTVEFGAEYETIREITSQDFLSDGYVTFSGNISGDNAVDFLLGKPNFFEQAAFVYRVPKRNLPGMYVIDTWKTTRRLTWSLGLRWNPLVPMLDTHGKQGIFLPSAYNAGVHSSKFANLAPGLLLDGDPGIPGGSVFSAHYGVFNPRVGFAHDVFGDGKTSVRGGYGMYVDEMSGIDGSSSYSPFTLTVAINYPQSYTSPYTGSGITTPFPIVGSLPQNYPFPLPMPAQPFYPGMDTPIIQQWNLSIEHQLPASTMVRLSYEGSGSYHLFGAIEGNQPVYNPAETQAQNLANTQARRPLGQYYQGLALGKTIGTANYNALVASVEKRMSHGLSGLAGYRWSKCLDEGESPWLDADAYSTNHTYYDYGKCSWDVSGQFIMSYVYHTPAVKSLGFVGRQVLSNWESTGILTLRSGLPYGATYGTDNALIGGGGNRVNIIGNPVLSTSRAKSQLLQEWFNPTAFAENPVGTLGFSGKDPWVGPGFTNTDFAMIKSFPIHLGHNGEGQHLDFRAEAFNLFNWTNFNNPNTNMSTATVGRITTALSPRIMQFALRFVF